MVRLTEEMITARTRVSDCSSVKKLNCWGIELTDVSILRKMKNVEILSLSVNNISSLKDFQNCVDLKDLFVRKNNIKDLNEVCYLQGLSKLRNLWLGENPCSEIEGYRLAVIKALPHLEKLDDTVIAPEEVQIAMVRGRSLVHPLSMTLVESSLHASPCGSPEVAMSKYVDEQDIDQRKNYCSSDEQRSYEKTLAVDEYLETDKKNANYDTSPVRQHPFNTRYLHEKNGRIKNLENNSRNNSYLKHFAASKNLEQDSNDRTLLRHNGESDNVNHRMYTSASPRGQNNPAEYIDERRIEFDELQRSMLDQSKREVITQSIEREDFSQTSGWTRRFDKNKRRSQFEFQKRPVTRNSNILSAVLCLVKELDYPSLEVVEMAVRSRIDELEE